LKKRLDLQFEMFFFIAGLFCCPIILSFDSIIFLNRSPEMLQASLTFLSTDTLLEKDSGWLTYICSVSLFIIADQFVEDDFQAIDMYDGRDDELEMKLIKFTVLTLS
jgi:hypothetical protein